MFREGDPPLALTVAVGVAFGFALTEGPGGAAAEVLGGALVC